MDNEKIPVIEVKGEQIDEVDRLFMTEIKTEILRLDKEIQMISQALQEKVGARKELQAIGNRKAEQLLQKYNMDEKKDWELDTEIGVFKEK